MPGEPRPELRCAAASGARKVPRRAARGKVPSNQPTAVDRKTDRFAAERLSGTMRLGREHHEKTTRGPLPCRAVRLCDGLAEASRRRSAGLAREAGGCAILDPDTEPSSVQDEAG